jgi:hypothetical protein
MRPLNKFLAGQRLDPTKPGRSIGLIDVYAVKKQHMEMGSSKLTDEQILGSMALVTTSILVPGGRPGRRRVGHDPRPCDTVFLHSLSFGCGILKNSVYDADQYQSLPGSIGYSHSIVAGGLPEMS